MEPAARKEPRNRKYKVIFTKEGEHKIKHVDYVWAGSAKQARQMIRDRGDNKIRKIKANRLL